MTAQQLDLLHVDPGPGWYTVTMTGARGRAKAAWAHASYLRYFESEADAIASAMRRPNHAEYDTTARRHDEPPYFAVERDLLWKAAAILDAAVTTEDGHHYQLDGEPSHPQRIIAAAGLTPPQWREDTA